MWKNWNVPQHSEENSFLWRFPGFYLFFEGSQAFIFSLKVPRLLSFLWRFPGFYLFFEGSQAFIFCPSDKKSRMMKTSTEQWCKEWKLDKKLQSLRGYCNFYSVSPSRVQFLTPNTKGRDFFTTFLVSGKLPI